MSTVRQQLLLLIEIIRKLYHGDVDRHIFCNKYMNPYTSDFGSAKCRASLRMKLSRRKRGLSAIIRVLCQKKTKARSVWIQE